MIKGALDSIYHKLFSRFGPQLWWPADTPFEVMVGAILTQNTSWTNVELAISNLKAQKSLAPRRLNALSCKQLAALIRPAGYYNIKAKRLKNFLGFFLKVYRGSVLRMRRAGTRKLREQLLAVNGIGPETADSILLYALDKPAFVVDAYTKRVLSRHRLIREEADYSGVQNLFMKNLKKDVKLFNEYHALLVRLGKDFCRKSKPRCRLCPLQREGGM